MIKETFDLREAVYRKVLAETTNEPRVVRAAKCLAEFLARKAVCVSPDDVLAGGAQYCNCAYSSPKSFRAEIEDFEKNHAPDERLYEFEAGLNAKLYQRGPGGHVIAGYDRVLAAGVDALIRNARQCAAAAEGKARDLALASEIVCSALSAYIGRYAEAARKAGKKEIARACEHVSHYPPESFFEAVQLFWLIHEAVIFEQYCGSMSLGRLDVTLGKFCEADLSSGKISRERAQDIITAFFAKLGGLKRGYQNVTLGGLGAGGAYVDNDVTRMCLAASKELMIDQPLLSLRCGPGMSGGLWDEALGLMQTGIGFPALFNDRVAIRSKINVGVSEEDAVNYGVVGCVEVSAPGREFAHTEGLRVNWAKIIELMFNGGKCSYTGHRFGLAENKDLSSIRSFDEFYDWYKAEFRHFLELGMDVTDELDAVYGENWPTPFMSSLMDGCVAKGLDVNAGGAVYNLTTVNGCGMADAADSLCAVRKAVFEDRMISLPELAEVLKNDFDGAENIRRALLSCPKFGNDDDRADSIMRDLTELFHETVTRRINPRGGAYQCGLYSVDHHAHMGRLTAALPEGRKAGVSLANGFSPAQGADGNGPTAVVNSVVKNDLAALGNGMVLDLKFQPAFFMKNKGQIRNLIETYFDLGGYELQANVVDRDTLLAAQAEPESHRNLIVRVSGFSAYFVDLNEVLQNEIIARTEHKGG